MKVLVTGAGGQLGADVVRYLDASGDDVVGFDRDSLDITDTSSISRVFSEVKPDTVINCAAFTAVDRCESDAELAHAINEHAVRQLAIASDGVGAHLVHVSTDYVFDGCLDRAYTEDDATNPQSVYGRSKLGGERAATEVLGDGVTIARTSWVCGEHGNNIVKLVQRLAREDIPMAFVDDQRGCPSFTADLAPALQWLGFGRPGGVVHLTNAGVVSWYEFVREILDALGHDPDSVRPISTAELDPPRPAPRPANSELENMRWRELGRVPLRDFRAPLAELAARL